MYVYAVVLRLIPTNPGIDLYVRVGRADHSEIQRAILEGQRIAGLVIDPFVSVAQSETIESARNARIDVVLDTRVMELALPGSETRRQLEQLPWAPLARQPAAALAGDAGRELARLVAEHVVARKLPAVLSPTHFIQGIDDPAFAIDRHVASALRAALDDRGATDTAIYYPVAMPAASLRDGTQSLLLADRLKALDIDAIWLRMHPFGSTDFGPLKLATYLTTSRNLIGLGVPIVAERTGTIGLALAAFGAAGAIEGGITLGERFDITSLLRPPTDSRGFSPAPRVYFPELGSYLSVDQAKQFFKSPLMRARFGCKAEWCCPRGWQSMLSEPRRHGLFRRTKEVEVLSDTPASERADRYLETILRPTTDALLQAARAEPALETMRHRYENARIALGAIRKRGRPMEFAMPPRGRRNRGLRQQPRAL